MYAACALGIACALAVCQAESRVPATAPSPHRVCDSRGSDCWESRRIIFDDEPLATAVERINRYSSDRLILADERIGALRISGVFRTDDLAGFVDTLTRYLPLQSERRHNAILLRARRPRFTPQTASTGEGFRRERSHSLI